MKDALVKAGSSVDAGKALGVLQNVLQGKKPAAPVIDPSSIDVPLTVSFTIRLSNEARAELQFPRLGYQLSVNGEKLVTGESTRITREGTTTLITIGNTFSSRSLSKNVR